MRLSLPEVDGSLAGDFIMSRCKLCYGLMTTHLSSSLGEQVGNPDSDAEEWNSQLTSLAGWFWCHLPGLQKGS